MRAKVIAFIFVCASCSTHHPARQSNDDGPNPTGRTAEQVTLCATGGSPQSEAIEVTLDELIRYPQKYYDTRVRVRGTLVVIESTWVQLFKDIADFRAKEYEQGLDVVRTEEIDWGIVYNNCDRKSVIIDGVIRQSRGRPYSAARLFPYRVWQ